MDKLLSKEEIQSYRMFGMMVDKKEAFGSEEYGTDKTFIPPEEVDLYLKQHGYRERPTEVTKDSFSFTLLKEQHGYREYPTEITPKIEAEEAEKKKEKLPKGFTRKLKEVYCENFGSGKFGEVGDVELMERFREQRLKKFFTDEEEKIIWLIIQNAICEGRTL